MTHSAQTPAKLVDFALEVLYGCIHNCYGCNVNRYDQNGYLPGDVDRLCGLFDDLKAHGRKMVNIEIGPTDFMSSMNTIDVFKDSIPILDRFETISLQSTFTASDEDIKTWAEALAPYLAGRQLKLKFPLDPRHWRKLKYLNRTMEKLKYFVSLLPATTYIKTYMLVNMKEYTSVGEDPLSVLQVLIDDITGHELHVDLLITEGRLPLDDINNREKLKSSFLYLSKLHDSPDIEESVRVALTFGNYYKETRERYSINSAGSAYEDKFYIYKNGTLYIPVFAGENVTIFDDALAVPAGEDWNTHVLDAVSNNLLISQLNYAANTNECLECEHVSGCIRKNIIQAMSIVRTKQCIMPKNALAQSRGMIAVD